MIQVRFLRSVPGYGYFRGDTGGVADDAAAALVNAGAAVLVPEAEGGDALCLLPEDMPMRELLAENGYVSVEQVAAAALVNAGAAVLVPEAEGGDALCLLPEDMPMRELLAENGYVSVEQVAAAGEALTEIAGIGKKSAERIADYCNKRLTMND